MKKLALIILILLPVMAFGQSRFRDIDSLHVTSDTIIIRKIIDSKNWNWHVRIDSIAGTKDGTLELVVADSFDEAYDFSNLTSPPDSAFVRYADNMTYTLTTNTYYSFYKPDLSYEFIGLRITMNSSTAMQVKWNFLKIVD